MFASIRDLTRLRSAIIYAYPLYEYARSTQVLSRQAPAVGMFDPKRMAGQYPGVAGPLLNRHVHVRDLASPADRAITTPNNDTLYTSAVLELSEGPVELTVPDSHERYLSIAFMDMFSDQVAYIGTRATEGRGGTYWLVGPDQNVDVPEGVLRLDLPSNDLWLLGRIFVSGSEDLDAARAVQSAISVRPVDEANEGRPFTTVATSVTDPENFLALVNEVLGRSPIGGHITRAYQFAGLGIRPGILDAYRQLPAWKRLVWSRALRRLEAVISRQVVARQSNQRGWMVPPKILGDFGENDEVRTAVSLVGFGALTIDEAIYFRAVTDAAGNRLDGRKKYRMRLPAEGVPVKAFWSLSMYAPGDDKRLYFYENELDRYAINSSSDGLHERDNGEIMIAMQRERPDDESLVWMPTPDGRFEAMFRAYLPDESLRSGAWTVPALVEVD